MVDIKFIIENPGLIKNGAAKKNVKVDIDKIVELYNSRKEKMQNIINASGKGDNLRLFAKK